MKKAALLFLVSMVAVIPHSAVAELRVVYPNVNGGGANLFGFAALKLALENSGRVFDLQITDTKVNDERARVMLKNKEIGITDFGTSPEFEQEFLPIYFPIDLGLNGWRIFLIHRENQSQFAEIKTIDDLRAKTAGQGIGWSDVQILEDAGLKVQTSSHIETLVRMTERKRFDFFPLGANEAHVLLETFKEQGPNVIVEPTILLIYPFARLFFVHKDNKELHDAVEAGLKKSFDNGSYLNLFRSHISNGALFVKANLKSRKQIFIDNINITEEFKRIPKEYSFSLSMIE